MSRSRNIKPGFFKNELLVELPFEYRLLFIGLWTYADREGRFEDRPTRIRMDLFPADSIDINAGLQALNDAGFILRFQHKGKGFCQVLAWHKHQNPHFREKKSDIESPESLGLCVLHKEEKPEASTGKDSGKPETSPEVARLIPDSLIPDSKEKHVTAPKGATLDAAVLDAYHEALPKCKAVAVLNPKRRRRIAVVDKLAKQICAQQGWEYDPRDFWQSYFAECANDPWMRGEVPNPHSASWKQNLDVLIAEDRFAGIMDSAIAAMRGQA